MNEITIYIIVGLILSTLLVGAGVLLLRLRDPKISERKKLHPLLILGIIFLFPGLLSLIMDGEESVFLSLGVVFTISGIVAQLLIRVPTDDHGRKHSIIGSLLGFSLGAATGVALSLVFGWPPILMILLLGALGLLAGLLLGRIYQSRIQV